MEQKLVIKFKDGTEKSGVYTYEDCLMRIGFAAASPNFLDYDLLPLEEK